MLPFELLEFVQILLLEFEVKALIILGWDEKGIMLVLWGEIQHYFVLGVEYFALQGYFLEEFLGDFFFCCLWKV